MNRGKNICKHLKEIRKRIAEENDIPLEIKECTYKGECRGTCPRCEAEMRFLENALAEKIKIGKVAAIAGLTLGLASTTHAQAPENKGVPALDTTDVHRTECCGTLKGTVFDIKTQETLPFVNVELKQDGKQVFYVTTDFDGLYTIKPIPFGDYMLVVSTVGYRRVTFGVTINKTGFTVRDIGIGVDSTSVLDECRKPVIEIGVPSSSVDEIVSQIGMTDPKTGKKVVYAPKEAMGEIQVTLPGTPASQSVPNEEPRLYDEKGQGERLIVR